MDDTFLYNYIKKAIRQKKNKPKDINEQNFAERYCQSQLMKKKLLTKSHSKMTLLMKNFHHVDTYIDLNSLIESINQIRMKESKQKQQQIKQQRKIQFPKSNSQYYHSEQKNNLLPVFMDNKSVLNKSFQMLQDRVQSEISDYLRRKQKMQSGPMNDLIDKLESNSNLLNNKLKNNSDDNFLLLDGYLNRLQNDDYDDNVIDSNFISKITQNYDMPSYQNLKRNKNHYQSTSLNSKTRKQEYQLLHKITTYLQIALENQHKSKWATKEIKKFRSAHGSFRFNKNGKDRSNFFLQDFIKKQKVVKTQQAQQNNQSNQTEINNPTNQNENKHLEYHINQYKKINQKQLNIIPKCSIFNRNKNQALKQNKIDNDSHIKKISQKDMPVKYLDKKIQRKLFKENLSSNINKTNSLTTKMIQQQQKISESPKKYTQKLFLTSFQKSPQLSLQKIILCQENININEDLQKLFTPAVIVKKYRRSRLYPNGNINPKDLFSPHLNKIIQKQKSQKVKKNDNTNKSTSCISINRQQSFTNWSKFRKSVNQNHKKDKDQELQQLKINIQPSLVNKSMNIKSLNHSLKRINNFEIINKNKSYIDKKEGYSVINKNEIIIKESRCNKKNNFKKRNKKQLILNKIQSFIKDVDYSQKVSKVENEYYDSAITKLEQMSRAAYQSFQPETLAYEDQIDQMKKFVNNRNLSLKKPQKIKN